LPCFVNRDLLDCTIAAFPPKPSLVNTLVHPYMSDQSNAEWAAQKSFAERHIPYNPEMTVGQLTHEITGNTSSRFIEHFKKSTAGKTAVSAEELEAFVREADAFPELDNPHVRKAKDQLLTTWVIFLNSMLSASVSPGEFWEKEIVEARAAAYLLWRVHSLPLCLLQLALSRHAPTLGALHTSKAGSKIRCGGVELVQRRRRHRSR